MNLDLYTVQTEAFWQALCPRAFDFKTTFGRAIGLGAVSFI